MRWVADIVYLLAGLLYLPIAIYNAVFLRKNRQGWGQRFGRVPRFSGDRPRIWIHAVSLGEMNATSTLVAELRRRRPDADLVVSSSTDTGFARGVQLYGAERVFRNPLDFSLVVSRALNRVRPSLIVLMELEVWPNLVRMASRRGIPVAVANGRLTKRSARRLARLGPFCRAMFRPLAWVGAQEEDIAYRFRGLGVPADRIEITSSLKWDTASIVDSVEGAPEVARACGLIGDRPIWVCGSTGPGEEEIILDAYQRLGTGNTPSRDRKGAGPSAPRSDPPILVIVPRRPERFGEVARLIGQRGFGCVRRSQCPDGTTRPALTPDEVLLGDTMGELRKFYSLSTVVFVGRSLVPMGGSDTMEVAALGKPMIVGPHNDNFKEAFEVFRAAGALEVAESADAMAAAVSGWLKNRERAQWKGDCARRAVKTAQGATRQTVDALVQLLPPTHSAPGVDEPSASSLQCVGRSEAPRTPV